LFRWRLLRIRRYDVIAGAGRFANEPALAPLSLSHDYLDFYAKHHDNQQQEEKMSDHLFPPLDEPAGPVFAGLLILGVMG
jgi:hypothetical protein